MIKRTSTLFLQVAIVLVACVALIVLIRFPLAEGRAKNLDLFSVYTDPFILYAYAASVVFFVALYKAFRLLGYIGQNKVFSPEAVSSVKGIKFCAMLVAIMIVLAGVCILIFHHKDDDPAGFLAMCLVLTFATVSVAIAASMFEKILQKAVDMKSENDLTI